jgi:hypothetical protein
VLQATLDLIRGKTAKATSADMRAALAQLSIEDAERAASDLEAERRRILLDGSDRELTAVEEKISAAWRQVERMTAAREELEARIAAIEAKEKADAFNAERKAIEDEAQAAADALRKEYPAIARKLIAMLERTEKADTATREFNRRIFQSAPHLRIEMVQQRVFNNFHPDGINGSLLTGVSLPDIDPQFAPAWNDPRASIRGRPMSLKAS